MGGTSSRWCLTVACCCAALAACGQSADRAGDGLVLTDRDRALWAPAPANRHVVPVLLYDGVSARDFARQMALLDYAGYETITLDAFVRFLRRERVSLPPRPLLLTFDGGRRDSWTGSDGILRKLGFNATVFVDVGPVEEEDPEYLTWAELNTMQRSGRWEVQVQSGTGHRRIRYGPAPGDVGAFYAYRGSEEVLGGWRERVFSDVTYGEEQVAHHVEGYRPLAFAPPYGNYGQAGTNDPHIPRELLARLLDSFDVVFTQDRSGFASPGAGATGPVGRIEITSDVSEGELRARLAPG